MRPVRLPRVSASTSTPVPRRHWSCNSGRVERPTSVCRTTTTGVTGPSAAPARRAHGSRRTAYLHALRDGRTPDDPRIGPSARPGWEWVADIHEGQAESLARRRDATGTAGQHP